MDLTHNIIEYVNCCVGAFANRFKLTLAQSYAYLRRFKGEPTLKSKACFRCLFITKIISG